MLENQTFKPLWVRTKSFGKSPAYLVYGRTLAGRYLLVPGIVFEDPPMKGMFMPITVRAMTSKEKKFYEMHRKDDLGG
ncbi:MAG: hypothetical protein H5U02_08120 [Clostridia bacterium]|nr:hypothetical protein [Clostridia bacterium]